MSFDWPLKKLSEVADVIAGGTPSTKVEEYYGEGIPWITPKDLSSHSNRYISRGERSITKLGLKNSSARVLPRGTVLFTSRAPIGYVAIAENELSTNQGFKNLVLKDDNCPEFFYYLLKSNVHLFESRASGSTFKEVSGKVVQDTELRIPPPSIQKQIANILGSIDQKIETNNRINQILEMISQAIFKSWFVDFEPVKAKIAALKAGASADEVIIAAMQSISGKSPKQLTHLKFHSPDSYAKLRLIAELFPSAMQDSEIGQVPEGWLVSSLEQEIDVVRGFSYKGKGLSESGTTMHNLNSVLEGGGYKYSGIKFYNLDFKDKYLVLPGDVLVANTEQGHDRYLIGFGAAVPYFYEKGIFSHHLYRVRPKTESVITKQYLAELFRDRGFVSTIQGYSNGTTVNMLPLDALKMPKIVRPNSELVSIFSSQASSLRQLIEQNYLQNQTLSELRDGLLPRLMSGELGFSDVSDHDSGENVVYGEEPLRSIVALIEREMSPRNKFFEKNYPDEQSSHENLMLSYNMTVSGVYGDGGVEYLKLPMLLAELKKVALLEKLVTTAVDTVAGVPLLMDAVTAVLGKYLGQKISFDQRTAIVLLAFPNQMIRKVSELLTNSLDLCTKAGQSPIDEDELNSILSKLQSYGLVSIGADNTQWVLNRRFKHEIKHWD